MSVKVRVKVLPNGAGLPLPSYASDGSAGADLYAALCENLIINPGSSVAVPTGISLEIPEGYEGQVRLRSGLARDYSIIMPNAPGTVDSDYRGELMVLLSNISDKAYIVKSGDRIAQLVLAKYERIDWDRVESLRESDRGEGGFGHSGR